KTVPYDATRYSYLDIVGEADYFNGMDQLQIVPGARIQWSNCLDLSASNFFVRGIHTGLQVDIFSKQLPLRDTGANKSIWVGGFLGFMIGNGW
ncbi:MAG: hypothetical protein NZ108_09265, partial [Bacteroidia bacterium]|nr:hypothetical protein [Bacteroidia bacterium]